MALSEFQNIIIGYCQHDMPVYWNQDEEQPIFTCGDPPCNVKLWLSRPRNLMFNHLYMVGFEVKSYGEKHAMKDEIIRDLKARVISLENMSDEEFFEAIGDPEDTFSFIKEG